MLISEQLKAMSENPGVEKVLSEFFLEKGAGLQDWSSRDVAMAVYVSASTVVRFCQRLGFKGYLPFKEAFLKEWNYLHSHFQGIDPNYPFAPGDDVMAISGRLEALYQETIRDGLGVLSMDVLEQAVQILDRAETIHILSSGSHQAMAYVFQGKMSQIGKRVICWNQLYGNMAAMISAHPQTECCILASYSGETIECHAAARLAASVGLPTIAITSFGNNTLSSLCDCVLNVSTREKLINNLGNFCFPLSLMFVLDLLYAGVFNQNYEKCLNKRLETAQRLENPTRYFPGLPRHSDNPMINDNKEFEESTLPYPSRETWTKAGPKA